MEVKDLIDILIEQNKSFIEQNKNYKDMLVFAVGSIITILVIFLTANFFTMNKMRKNEIEKIKTEILDDIQKNSLPELKQELEDRLEAKLGSLKSNISSFESKLTSTKSKQNDFKKDILKLEAKLHNIEGDLAFEEKVYANAFFHYIESGKIYLEIKSGMISHTLNSLEKTAKELPYVITDIQDFNVFASKLDTTYQTQVEKITDILKGKDAL